MNRLIPFLSLCSLSFCLNAQTVNISNLAVDPIGQVTFTCVIDQKHSPRETYNLQVYSSADNFVRPIPLNLKDIKVGSPLNVTFNGSEKIGNYQGAIQFKFVAEASSFPVEIIDTKTKFKKGKAATISWNDYHSSGWYDVGLYKGGMLVKSLVESHSGNSFTTKLPKKMDSGEYEIRVTPSKNKTLYSEDYLVTIKSSSTAKIALGAGGILAAGGALILSGGGSGGGDTGAETLPNAPFPSE
jgi:hypothetical protein